MVLSRSISQTEGEGTKKISFEVNLVMSCHIFFIFKLMAFMPASFHVYEISFYYFRFHLRWGCREVLYDKSADGETYVTGLAMSKVVYSELYLHFFRSYVLMLQFVPVFTTLHFEFYS